jgi:hypothetical protein
VLSKKFIALSENNPKISEIGWLTKREIEEFTVSSDCKNKYSLWGSQFVKRNL